jgi:DNA-binding transcriptional regulator YhcF (GntR family)
MEVSSQMGPFSIVPEWVLNRGLSPTALKLYIVMARFADWNTGMAFPSRETLAERMGCSLKTVDRAVIEVVAAECVSKISRGRYASALYKVFQVDPRRTDLSQEETDLSTEGTYLSSERTDLSKREDKNDHITITTELEPLELELLNDIVEAFNDFWNIYPRKQGKGKAKEAFIKASKLCNVELILLGAERYAADPNLPDPKFVPLPATWLNQERWDDEPLPLNRELTNSERNIQNLRASMALLENKEMKEVESNESVGSQGVIDFGINLRSADSV